MIRKLLLLFIFVFHFSVFANNEQTDSNITPPKWIENPGIGAVGSSPLHIMGRHAQEELAITRARTRLAATLGVNISSKQVINEHVKNDHLFIQSQKNTSESLSHKGIKTTIKAIWHDKTRDIIYAWVIPVN